MKNRGISKQVQVEVRKNLDYNYIQQMDSPQLGQEILQKVSQPGDVIGIDAFFGNQYNDSCAVSLGVSHLIYFELDDFLYILKQFPIDFQIFSQIKDEIKFNNKNFYKSCQADGMNDHTIQNCKIVFYKPNSQILYMKYSNSEQIYERKKKERKMISKNAYKSKDEVRRSLIEIRRDLVQDLQTDSSYSNESDDTEKCLQYEDKKFVNDQPYLSDNYSGEDSEEFQYEENLYDSMSFNKNQLEEILENEYMESDSYSSKIENSGKRRSLFKKNQSLKIKFENQQVDSPIIHYKGDQSKNKQEHLKSLKDQHHKTTKIIEMLASQQNQMLQSFQPNTQIQRSVKRRNNTIIKHAQQQEMKNNKNGFSGGNFSDINDLTNKINDVKKNQKILQKFLEIPADDKNNQGFLSPQILSPRPIKKKSRIIERKEKRNSSKIINQQQIPKKQEYQLEKTESAQKIQNNDHNNKNSKFTYPAIQKGDQQEEQQSRYKYSSKLGTQKSNSQDTDIYSKQGHEQTNQEGEKQYSGQKQNPNSENQNIQATSYSHFRIKIEEEEKSDTKHQVQNNKSYSSIQFTSPKHMPIQSTLVNIPYKLNSEEQILRNISTSTDKEQNPHQNQQNISQYHQINQQNDQNSQKSLIINKQQCHQNSQQKDQNSQKSLQNNKQQQQQLNSQQSLQYNQQDQQNIQQGQQNIQQEQQNNQQSLQIPVKINNKNSPSLFLNVITDTQEDQETPKKSPSINRIRQNNRKESNNYLKNAKMNASRNPLMNLSRNPMGQSGNTPLQRAARFSKKKHQNSFIEVGQNNRISGISNILKQIVQQNQEIHSQLLQKQMSSSDQIGNDSQPKLKKFDSVNHFLMNDMHFQEQNKPWIRDNQLFRYDFERIKVYQKYYRYGNYQQVIMNYKQKSERKNKNSIKRKIFNNSDSLESSANYIGYLQQEQSPSNYQNKLENVQPMDQDISLISSSRRDLGNVSQRKFLDKSEISYSNK
ncbi:Cyclic nucleotide-binding protein [Pseudocohnilembus persalinus]|uniref:Cyclic nucleotide-binding protein n=1 Tax=Pseudocohnilembus persalinus TaxID=266149 RepID=A0A0V0QPP3_PSEPJ|nr:Cyclic nucleotide-binding protein [Pseudocohnilembus persalinus]|eukprot:KRX04235.1 Cyclic nucleotide-binding protein [Pseudocohnilembus persalinus]